MDWVGSSGGVCPRCVMMTGRCHTVCWGGGGTHPLGLSGFMRNPSGSFSWLVLCVTNSGDGGLRGGLGRVLGWGMSSLLDDDGTVSRRVLGGGGGTHPLGLSGFMRNPSGSFSWLVLCVTNSGDGGLRGGLGRVLGWGMSSLLDDDGTVSRRVLGGGGGNTPPRSEWVHEESVGVLLLAGTVCNQFRRWRAARWSRPPESPDDPGVVPRQVGILEATNVE